MRKYDLEQKENIYGYLHVSGSAPAIALDRSRDLAGLRARIRAIERGGATHPVTVMPLGVEALDHCLSGGGLTLGRVHEVIGAARSEVRDAASFGFVVAVLARLTESGGDVLWCPRGANPHGGMLSARGLAGLGLDPGRIIVAETRGDTDRLWAMEEGLGCSGLAAVVAELGPAHPKVQTRDSVSCRRLQLAAEASGVTGILLRPGAGTAASAIGTPESRWRVTSAPQVEEAEGRQDWRPCWRVELLRARNGKSGEASLIWEARRGVFHPAGSPAIRPHSLITSPRSSTNTERTAA
jgi:protein ImuA